MAFEKEGWGGGGARGVMEADGERRERLAAGGEGERALKHGDEVDAGEGVLGSCLLTLKKDL